MAHLTLYNISKRFGDTMAVENFNLAVEKGEFVSFLGPSGCGKTTTLRMIAGFEKPSEGTIAIDDADITDKAPNQRNVGMVFQSYALFPNMTVAQNIGFGLRIRKEPEEAVKQRITEMLSIIHLEQRGDSYPYQLSGGQQQRVALARALANRPQVLLLDEPLSALDAKIRVSLRAEIRSIQRELGITAIYVTHDQEEAFAIADRILLLHAGIIVRAGTPAQVWNDPQSAWAARFLNVGNVVEGKFRIRNSEFRIGKVETSFGIFEVRCGHRHNAGEEVALLLKQVPTQERGLQSAILGGLKSALLLVRLRVEDVLFNRDQFKVTLRGGLVVQLDESPKVGSEISVTFRAECLGDV